MKLDLKDVTFLLPIRVDSIVRLENVLEVIHYLQKCFKTNIIVHEGSSNERSLLKRLLPKKSVQYYYNFDEDPIFYRTKYLNLMTLQVKTKYLAIWDVDVIIPKKQILDSVNALRTFSFDIAFPYDGTFLDTSEILRLIYIKERNINILIRNHEKMNKIYGEGVLCGGAIIVNTDKYIQSGMENESFYGWGPEDSERFCRWSNLEYRIYRSNGPLFHFTHPRDLNGKFNSHHQRQEASKELQIIKNSSSEEILERINCNNTIVKRKPKSE